MTKRQASLIALIAGAGLPLSAASAQVIITNCNIATGATTLHGDAAPAGGLWSEVARDATDPTTANTTAGFGGSGALRLADDFVVPAGGATITAIRIFAYTNGQATPNISAATLQIWNGAPNAGGAVIFGDQTTNRLVAGSNVFTNYYRTFNTVTPPTCGGTLTAATTGRHLQQADIAVNQVLGAGTYWIDFNYTGPSFSPPSTIATAIGRQCNPSNSDGLQFNAAWVALGDTGQGCALTTVNQDIYFEVLGQLGGATTGACCLGAPTYSCTVTTQALCTTQGGTYAGDNVTCAQANCPPPPTGACCSPTGTCSVVTQAACTTAGGTYAGNNVTCAQANCQPTGWVEVGDAGDTQGTAQNTVGGTGGNTPLHTITGTIAASGDADVYQIKICDEANFLATTVGGTTMDTQLFLFDSTGHGVVMDDDDVGASGTLQSRITTQFVTSNGSYYLGISSYDNDPWDSASGYIWNDTNPGGAFGPEWVPNGPAAANAWAGFDHGSSGSGAYTISLTGACFNSGAVCYANCDLSTQPPILNANDFQCFLNKYAANDPYANCDGSTQPPILNANDFQCFLNAYAAGCT